MRIGSVILVVWLVIGALAAYQRNYFSSEPANCAQISTVLLTVVAGPLNYVGLNPKVDCPSLPQPSPDGAAVGASGGAYRRRAPSAAAATNAAGGRKPAAS